MTLFYFDVSDGRETSRDMVGMDFADLDAARREARRAAAEIAKELIPENDVGTVEITIREQDHGPALFSVVWASVAEARES
jgi:hypothetical protein